MNEEGDKKFKPTYPEKKPLITLRDLYPHFNEEQLQEAGERLAKYVEIVLDIYEGIESDPEAYAEFKALTRLKRSRKMDPERSFD